MRYDRSMRKKSYLILAVTALLVIILIIISADLGILSPALVVLYRFPMGDKVGHLLLNGMLAFLVALAAGPKKAGIWLGLLAVAITLEEFSQAVLPNRTFSLLDLAFSLLGIVVFGFLGARLARGREKSNYECNE